MKTYLLLLIVSQCVLGTAFGFDLSMIPPQSTTELSDIEHKYRFVEIWDVKGRSKKDFLSTITSYSLGISEQSLKAMGHSDGFRFPLTSGKLLITTRSAPDYRVSPAYQRIKSENYIVDVEKWKHLKGLEFNGSEAQPIGASVQSLSKQEVLSVLYLSDDESMLQRASSVVGNFLETQADLFDVLPLLLRKEVNVQPAIEDFLTRFHGKIDWESQVDFLPELINNPNPFEALLVLKILDKTGFNKQQMEQCKRTKLVTLIELLRSDFLTEEKNYVLAFLNRYSNDALESNVEAWIGRLDCA